MLLKGSLVSVLKPTNATIGKKILILTVVSLRSRSSMSFLRIFRTSRPQKSIPQTKGKEAKIPGIPSSQIILSILVTVTIYSPIVPIPGAKRSSQSMDTPSIGL